MKIAIHIFSLYMLALSLVPCSDGAVEILDSPNQSFDISLDQVADHDHQHSNDCGDDTCPPFCICSCCSAALDTPAKQQFEIRLPIVLLNTIPSRYRNEISFSYSQSIWQPPKA